MNLPGLNLDAPEMTDSAERLWRFLNGHDITDLEKRAEHIMQTTLDGLTIGPSNRNSIKMVLVEHFEQIRKDAAEH